MHDEAATLAAIRAGDAGAFGRFVASAELPVRRSLRTFAAVVDVEAVVQEAFLRVWQVAPRFTPDGRPRALLRFTVTTARHVAIAELRRGSPTREQLDALERELAAAPGTHPITPDPHLRRALDECRARLPPQPRSAMGQRLASEGQDDVTLAQRAGMTLNTFLQNVTRARRLLAECLQRAGVDLDVELAP